jgi:hypothetical protein
MQDTYAGIHSKPLLSQATLTRVRSLYAGTNLSTSYLKATRNKVRATISSHTRHWQQHRPKGEATDPSMTKTLPECQQSNKHTRKPNALSSSSTAAVVRSRSVHGVHVAMEETPHSRVQSPSDAREREIKWSVAN